MKSIRPLLFSLLLAVSSLAVAPAAAGSGPHSRSRAEAAGRAAQGQAEARAGARGERDRDQEGAEGGGQGRPQGDLREERGEVGRQQPARTVDRGADRRHRGHLDEPRRQPGRQGDRLRPAGRPLHDADRRRRGAGAHPRRRLGDAAALQPGRQVDRLHQRPGRRRQHLGHEPRRHEPARGHQGDLPPAQQPGLVAGRPVHRRRASTSPPSARSAPARCGSTTARGGDGLQLTKKPNDQKDAGEPAFSPDGRYVYYSQDITPGAGLRVQQGPQRRDLRHPAARPADRQDRSASSPAPGGSVRPTPSPDGKTLAFIRRVRGKSVLHLMDLRSGRDRPLYDGLDRDMQETWSIHGVYPSMAWTPDTQVARLLGRRQDPAPRRRQPQGRARSPSTSSTTRAGHRRRVRFPRRGRADELRRPRCCAG